MSDIQDGSAVFQILDKRKEKVRQEYVDLVYPVGIVVAIANDKKPAFMEYGTWEKVAEDRVLQGSSDSHAPGTKLEAGLPNITGNVGGVTLMAPSQTSASQNPSGAFAFVGGGSSQNGIGPGYNGAWNIYKNQFNASKSNSIYGKSETVQPPAYVVAYWQRTA